MHVNAHDERGPPVAWAALIQIVGPNGYQSSRVGGATVRPSEQ
jgi:hypothetical protein